MKVLYGLLKEPEINIPIDDEDETEDGDKPKVCSAKFYSNQGIIDSTETETFAKEPKLAKLLRGLRCGTIKIPLVFLVCL